MGYTYALSWKLFIIRLLSEYFATLLKNIYLKKTLQMFHISSQIVLFSYGKVKDVFFFLKIRIKFHLGRTKGRGKRGYGGEAQNEIFLQNSHYYARYKLYLTNCWSDKLLITTIVIGMPKNLSARTFK